MDRFVIKGGHPLQGEVRISGAKNAALPLLASTLLSREACVLSNVPQVVDIRTMGKLLEMLGAKVSVEGDRISVCASGLHSTQAPYQLVKTMRASILVLGPLLARFGEAAVSLPGGCAIGSRPVNLHLAGFERLGAEVGIEAGYIRAKVSRLQGTRLTFDIPTVTGTENLMMAACLADGTTVLENAAKEPEVVDLAHFLVQRGANIHGAGSDCIHIEGVSSLKGGEYAVVPDRIEAGTFLAAGAITGGEVLVRDCRPGHLEAFITKLKEFGMGVSEGKDWVRLQSSQRPKGVDIKTFPYPGFPTDMQAPMMALLSVARGTSVISETVFEGRLIHVQELQRMGADIRVEGNHAVVHGRERLTGAPVMASDLRAGAGLIVAGLAAEGETEVSRVYHVDRGYERFESKLRSLGASVQREKTGRTLEATR